ncbi:indole-3-glycerol-phosphate synthase [Desulfovibrio falkowii]|uniref:indole-3-glycerol-phosphate synthase n=1 Tax=Desulfovibrio falkowii TaxID=3136602 RepID=A0ABQ0E673_9BACT|nr:indole-3-glycerol-phosphate synthase [uncultured Desulfovibrio sp.]
MLLERFIKAKTAEVEGLRRLAEQGKIPAPLDVPRPEFSAALCGRSVPAVRLGEYSLAVVAEYKRASPSRGVICENIGIEEAVRQYAASGAGCLSILTEETYFHGDISYLHKAADPALYAKHQPPLLRKDFIFDPLQVAATAATPASALLLIVRLTPDVRTLRSLREQAESLGMQAVVEVFDREDLDLARQSGARIIQVNARDLGSLVTDRKAPLDLIRACPPQKDEIWIAASGIDSGGHLLDSARAGFAAVLVGSALMAGGTPGLTLTRLLEQAQAAGDAASCTAGEKKGHAY